MPLHNFNCFAHSTASFIFIFWHVHIILIHLIGNQRCPSPSSLSHCTIIIDYAKILLRTLLNYMRSTLCTI